jgi:hypothetical protein
MTKTPSGSFLCPPVVAGASSAPPFGHKKTSRMRDWFGHKAICFCRPGRTILESFCSGFTAISEFINLNIRVLGGKPAITFYLPEA